MLEHLFQKAGVDWTQFKALLSVSIQLDVRQNRIISGEKKKWSPLMRSLILYAFMGLTMAVKLMGQATPFLYVLLLLTYSMVMAAFSIVLEFGHAIVIPEDIDILAFRPVSNRTYFLARLCHLLFFTLLVGTALCLLPAVLGCFLKGGGIVFSLLFFIVAQMANLTAGSFIVLVYTGLMRILPRAKLKDLLVTIQLGISFFIFFGYQLLPRWAGVFLKNGGEVQGLWLYFTPSAWFAGIVHVFTSKGNSLHLHLTLIAAAVMIVLFGFSFRRISLQYANKLMNLQEESNDSFRQNKIKRKAIVSGFILHFRNIIKNYDRGAGFQMASFLIRRDRFLKSSLAATLGIPLALIVLSIIDKELKDPFIYGLFAMENGMSVVFIFLLFLMFYSGMTALTYSQTWEAAWILLAAPLTSLGRFIQGVKLAFIVWIIIPFFIFIGAVYTLYMSWIHAVQHIMVLFLFVLCVTGASALSWKRMPFSKQRQRGERSEQFIHTFLAMPVLFVFIVVMHYLYKVPWGWWQLMGGLLLLLSVIEWITIKRFESKHQIFLERSI